MQVHLCYTEVMTSEDHEYLTTREAAERLGVTRERVYALIKAGRLPAEKFGPVWMILEDDLELVKDRKPGRPRSDKSP
jgi:excisionase family DNA binding protein